MKRRIALQALAATALVPGVHAQTERERPWRLAAQLNRGINFGNMLESPTEGAWGLRVEQRFIDLVGRSGFTQGVRLPVRWSNHASLDAEARIDPKFFDRVQDVVERLLARGATVMLNMHHYRQLDGDGLDPGERPVAQEVVRPRFLAMWDQIARRFAKADERLVLEPYNEPHGALEADWSALFAQVHAVIRRIDPERTLVVGPTHWNAATHLARLRLPDDPNLIATVHHYEPFEFTHQGAEWVQPMKPLGVDCCSAEQLQAIESPLSLAAEWSKAQQRPMVVGEFGAYSKAKLEARVNYLRAMRTAMERHGLPWVYWELASGFGVFDPKANRMRQPLYQALYGR